MKLSLPTDSDVRKTYPLFAGLFGYFGAALAAVANHSWKNNEKHNPGKPLHWSIDKSNDHAECVLRHILDLGDMLGSIEYDYGRGLTNENVKVLLYEADALAWRALALNQTLRMRFADAPLPFNARRTEPSHAYKDWSYEAERQQIRGHFPRLQGYPSPRCSICEQQACICEQQLG